MNGGMEKWRRGELEDWRNGRMEECREQAACKYWRVECHHGLWIDWVELSAVVGHVNSVQIHSHQTSTIHSIRYVYCTVNPAYLHNY